MIYDNVNWMEVDDHGATTSNGYVTHRCLGPYTGRVQREGYTTITTEEQTPKTAIVEFIQLPKQEHVTFDAPSYQATAAGGNITITGKTNAPRLDFALTLDTNGIGTLPTYFSITVDGQTIGNQAVSGQVFVGDPGADGDFDFTIIIAIDANTTMGQRSCRLVGTGSTGITGYTDIIQEAGDSYLYVDEVGTTSKTITFTAAGTSGGSSTVDVDVLSNDDWSVSVSE